MLYDNFNAEEAADLMIDKLRATSQEEIEIINSKLDAIVGKINDINEEYVNPSESIIEGHVEGVIIDALTGNSIEVEDTPIPDIAYAMDTDEMTEMVKAKPVQAKPVKVVEELPPEDGYVDVDPVDAMIEEMRRKKGTSRSNFGYDVLTSEDHYPLSTVITSRKKGK